MKKIIFVAAAALLIGAPFQSVVCGQTTKRWTDDNHDWNIVANLWSNAAPTVTTTTWTDGNGDWNTAGNWDNGVPNSTTSAVISGTGHTVSLSAAGSTNNLTLASGNTLNIVNNLSLAVFGSSISDSGTINLSSGGNVTDLIINNANTTLSGTGTLIMSNNSQNFIFGSTGADILTNQSTIQGSGNIGDNQMALVNSGTINANNGIGSNTLIIQVSNGATNTGTLEATLGSNLVLQGGTFTNTGGTIKALNNAAGGSTVNINGADIIGGTLTTTGNGVIFGNSGTILDGTAHTVTNSGLFEIANNNSTTILGTINNTGTILLNSVGNITDLIVGNNTGATSATINGTVTMINNSQNFIFGALGTNTLTNNGTIQGSGNIGDGQMALVNSGTIDANSGSGSNSLIIQTSNGTTNHGILEATTGSNLILEGASGGNFTNTGATVEAVGSGSTVELNNGVTITGGTLTTSGGGLIFSNNSATLSGLTVSTGSNYQVNNNTATNLVGTITNNGTITLASGGNVTNLIMNGNVTLTGTGVVTMSNNSQNFIFGSAATNILTNQETIQGSGNIGDGQMALVNSGTIDANSGSGSNSLIIQTSNGTTNHGILEATTGSNLILEGASGGNFTNTGATVEAVGSGSTVELNNGVTITGGTLTTSGGGLIFSNNSATLSGLTVSTGSNYQVNNNTATNLVGTITNNGTITLASGGNVTNLIMNGNVTLTGTGVVTMSNNSQNFIFGSAATNILTNQETIQGSGNIGDGQMALVNSGTIDANSGSGSNPLIIQVSNGATNTHTLEATNSSVLQLNGGTVTNTGGTIEALGNGAAVELENGVTITGGTLTSTGTGIIESLNSTKLSGVTLSTGSNYLVPNNTTTTLVSRFTNSGTFTLDSVGNITELFINGNVSLSGRGAVVMSNNSQNFILGVANTAVLTNNSTIEGSGNVGDNAMGLVNGSTGVINANNGAGSNTLFIDVDTKNFNNQGTLIVGSGSVMTIEGSGSFLNMNTGTSTLTGGTYNVTGTLNCAAGSNGILTDAANITLSGTSAEIFNTTNSTNALTNLNSVATSGSFTINSGANFTTAGNFTNNGILTVGSGSAFVVNLANSLTNFNSSTHTLTGGTYIDSGTLQFANANIQTIAANTSVTMSGASAKIEDQTGAAVGLTNLATNNGSFAIAGSFNFTTAGNFTNNGTLNVGSGTKFVVNLADSLTNFNSSTHTLTGGTYIDSGTLQFANASIVTNDASITLSGAASKIVNQSNVDALATTFATNDPGSTFALASARNFTTPGNFTNNGTLSIGNGTKFVVNLADSLTNFNSTTHTLTGGTYNVTGTLQFANANVVTNAANITLTGASSKILDQSNNNGLANFATNNGSFALAGNRSFTTAGNFTNAGTFTINTGSTFTLGGPGMFTQSGGTTTDDGSLSAPGAVNLQGGSLFGKGLITGALTSSSTATISPGDSATATAILRDTGAYSQNGGALNIEINGTTAGTKYDQLNPTTASLSGTLNISRPTGFVPNIGNTFKIMNFTSESGTFATVNGLSINNTEHFNLTYQPTDVLLTVVSGPSAPLWAGRHAFNVDFTGADGNKPQRLSKAPPFDSSKPGNPTIGKQTRTVINIRDSGQLLSMLDHAVPDSHGRLTVSHHNRMNGTEKTDHLNADRMMKADRSMADIRRMRERGMINPGLGGGKRAF